MELYSIVTSGKCMVIFLIFFETSNNSILIFRMNIAWKTSCKFLKLYHLRQLYYGKIILHLLQIL